jgi:hypothetical protein
MERHHERGELRKNASQWPGAFRIISHDGQTRRREEEKKRRGEVEIAVDRKRQERAQQGQARDGVL